MISGQTLSTSQLGSSAEKHNTLQGVTESTDFYHMTLFSMEIFVSTRQQFLPDPEFDSVTAIFYAIWHDGPKQNSYGLIATDPNVVQENRGQMDVMCFRVTVSIQIPEAALNLISKSLI